MFIARQELAAGVKDIDFQYPFRAATLADPRLANILAEVLPCAHIIGGRLNSLPGDVMKRARLLVM
jgi:hypothetical protein